MSGNRRVHYWCWDNRPFCWPSAARARAHLYHFGRKSAMLWGYRSRTRVYMDGSQGPIVQRSMEDGRDEQSNVGATDGHSV